MASARDRLTRQVSSDEAPEMVFEIRNAERVDAERLGLEQARVLWEVTQWVAQRRSGTGQGRAA